MLLSRLAGTSDVVVGSPTAGRGAQELEDVVGMFVNTLVLRTPVDARAGLQVNCGSVRDVDVETFAHLPLEYL